MDEANSVFKMILAALDEDRVSHDVTTNGLGLSTRLGVARLIAKQDLVISGADLVTATVKHMDPAAQITWYFRDSDMVLKGQHICMIQGDLIKILKAERTALNFLGHLCGIATLTRQYVAEIQHTPCKILDTRKTLPLFRDLEKKAVRDGGGTNHRRDLSDAIMIKDNHIRAAGSITKAILAVREHSQLHMTVETSNLDEVKEAVALKPNRIMLDNMSNQMMSDALLLIPKNIETEASGNMSLDRIKSVAELGVNYISIGKLTHSAPQADISLIFEW